MDYKLHGLGHLTNPFPNNKQDWHEEVWIDLLGIHYSRVSSYEIEQKYAHFFAITRMTISTANQWERFQPLNNGKDWCDQIKPYNFFSVGFQMVRNKEKIVKPLAPFSKDPQSIVHEEFVDYETGERKQGLQYFKPLSKTILQYSEHKEFKFDGDVGLLKRKHIQADCIIHVGKEANNIENQSLNVISAQIFSDMKSICERILKIRQYDAEKAGVDRKTFQRIKERIRKDGEINLKTLAVKRLLT